MSDSRVISADDLKSRYMWGMSIRDENGNELPNDVLEFYIDAAQERIEQRADLVLYPTECVDSLDYYVYDYAQWGYIPLTRRPFISVSSLTMVFADQTVFTFPHDWIKVNEKRGTIQIFPVLGSIQGTLVVTGNGAWLPIIFRRWEYAPQLWKIEYTAGYPKGECPKVIQDAIGKEAMIGLSQALIDLVVGPSVGGVTTVVDGVSQSTTLLRDYPKITQYRQELQYFYDHIVPLLRGIDFAVL